MWNRIKISATDSNQLGNFSGTAANQHIKLTSSGIIMILKDYISPQCHSFWRIDHLRHNCNEHTHTYNRYIYIYMYIYIYVSIYVRAHIFVCFFFAYIIIANLDGTEALQKHLWTYLRVDPENPVSSSFNKIIMFPGCRLQHQEKYSLPPHTTPQT